VRVATAAFAGPRIVNIRKSAVMEEDLPLAYRILSDVVIRSC
jgi:hypothetical protein